MKAGHGVPIAIAVAGHARFRCGGRPRGGEARGADHVAGDEGDEQSSVRAHPAAGRSHQRDSGTETCSWKDPRIVMREGQRVEVYDPIICTEKGKLGTLTTRSRIEWVDAGSGYHVGVGTWKVVRGTGQYGGVAGSGRSGNVWLDRGPWSGRAEGFLARP